MMAEGSTAARSAPGAPPALAPEDAMRAQAYTLLAALLRSPPDTEMLAALQGLQAEADDSEIGRAVGALARIAGSFDAGRAQREYHDLFIGIGRGELVPYGSYYLTGFLNEKPLGELRREMWARGFARAENVREPEDHVASLMEMMASMIEGRHAAPVPLAEQAAFFSRHVGSWAGHFFKDLEGARAAVLYAPVGTIGRVLMEVEAQAFAMGAAV